MIVVAIIGILAAIAIPAYQDYTKKSAEAACMSETKGYANILYSHVVDPNSVEDDLPAANESACDSITPTGKGTATVLTGTPKDPGTKTITCNFATGANCAFGADKVAGGD